ncbi:MAG: FliH/SctL family protein, partial [Polyangiales bacterium]
VDPDKLAELEQSRQAFAQAAVELAIATQRALEQTEKQLLQLAVAVAEAIVGRTLQDDAAVHAQLAKEAVAMLRPRQHARLRAAPDAAEALVQVFGSARPEVDGVQVEVVADPQLEGLGCIAEAEDVQIDARVGERLAQVLCELEERRRSQELEDLE